jgi:hypothetical protein
LGVGGDDDVVDNAGAEAGATSATKSGSETCTSSSTCGSTFAFASTTSSTFFTLFSPSSTSAPIPNISLNNLFSSFNLVISASLSNAQSALPSVPEYPPEVPKSPNHALDLVEFIE